MCARKHASVPAPSPFPVAMGAHKCWTCVVVAAMPAVCVCARVCRIEGVTRLCGCSPPFPPRSPIPQAYGTTDGSVVWAYSPCHPEDKDPTHQNESWDVDATKNRIVEISSGKCLDTLAYSQAPVIINTCSGSVTQTVRPPLPPHLSSCFGVV